MQPLALKVGDLAKQTGVSVRTLHYYDEIGLLRPSQRNEAGYRLYGKDDIIRLQQIVSLRQIGFSLEQIRDCLAQPQCSPHQIVQLHLSQLRQQMELQQRLYTKLEAIAQRLQSTETISVQEFIQLIEVTTMIEKYYTPEQRAYLNQRAEALGAERIQQVEAEWQTLIAQARTAMENGIEPTNDAVLALARRSQELVQEFTGGNAAIEQSLQTMYQQEGVEAASQGTIDTAVMAYLNRAITALSQSS